jgi:hypothetical protein
MIVYKRDEDVYSFVYHHAGFVFAGQTEGKTRIDVLYGELIGSMERIRDRPIAFYKIFHAPQEFFELEMLMFRFYSLFSIGKDNYEMETYECD